MTVGELIDVLKSTDPNDDVNIYLLGSGTRIPLEIEDIDFLKEVIEFILMIRRCNTMIVIDTRKIKEGSKVIVKRIEDDNILTFEFHYVGYKHTNFQLIEQSKYTPVLGCRYYSRKDKLNDWFNNNGKFVILNVEY